MSLQLKEVSWERENNPNLARLHKPKLSDSRITKGVMVVNLNTILKNAVLCYKKMDYLAMQCKVGRHLGSHPPSVITMVGFLVIADRLHRMMLRALPCNKLFGPFKLSPVQMPMSNPLLLLEHSPIPCPWNIHQTLHCLVQIEISRQNTFFIRHF